MKTDPFTDVWLFLIGAQPDQQKLGWGGYALAALFVALLIASAFIARANWRADPAQRTAGNLWTWLFRVLMGSMWFQGAIWKLPLPVSGGLQYWTEQMAENAAYPFFAAIVRTVMLPNMAIVDPLVLMAELGLAISFILGLIVRPVAVLGALYVLGLWIGLYRHPAEWPWIYVFIAIVHGMFAIHTVGRSLGLDAALDRRSRGTL